jgi:glycosyltransferase involved in cell wall biosynthesis
MNPSFVLHAMNSVYGRRNLYGARSAYIACAAPPETTVLAYCRDAAPGACCPPNVTTERIRLALRYRAIRALMTRIGSTRGRSRASWRGLDSLVRGRILGLERDTVEIFHTWEWMPRTITAIRRRHRNLVILRDVTIARRSEYRSGEDIVTESRHVDRLLSPSRYVTGCLVEWGVDQSKIIEIPFGVDTDLFQPLRVRSPTPVRFAFSGKVSKRKGVLTLLDAWQKIGLPGAELHLYGTVAPEVARRLPDYDNVHTYGFVDLTAELAKNHVFVFPSPFEGSSKAVYEALACGLPVITTPNAGSVVRDGLDGFIVPPDQGEALSDAMVRLATDAALREQMGASARTRAEEFTWYRYADRIWQTYRSVLPSSTETGEREESC